MPRIIVTTDPVSSDLTDETPVLLDEQVDSVHLSTTHAAGQLVERLAWAVRDAENAQRARLGQRRLRPGRPARKRRPRAHRQARGAVAA